MSTTDRLESRTSKRTREEEMARKQQKKLKKYKIAVERFLGRDIPPELDLEFESEPESDENEHVGQDPATLPTLPTTSPTNRPSLNKESISTVARTAKTTVFMTMPLYTHWFAAALYEVFLKFKPLFSPNATTDPTIEISIRNEKFTVNTQAVMDASSQIQDKQSTVVRGHGISATASLQGAETYFSTIYSMSLNRLMKHCETVSIVHQAPIRKKAGISVNPDAADMAGIRMQNTSRCETIFVSDLKMHNKELSDTETALYAKFVSVNQETPTDLCLLVLGLSGNRSSATLSVYLMGKRTIWAVPIVSDVKPSDPSLLATLSIGLQSLGKQPIFYKALNDPVPFKGEKVISLAVNNRTFLRTVGGKKCVVKFFDANIDPARRTNLAIMKTAGLKVKLEVFTTDSRITYVQYDYYIGDHKPTKLEQFYNILCMLHKLHDSGIVHGDIRLANLVFDHKNCAGYLIDYDLARKSGDLYPNGYLLLDVRHEDVASCCPMLKIHDRHSLAWIVELFYPSAKDVIENIRSSTKTLMDAAALLKN